jgi:hypothetical protein
MDERRDRVLEAKKTPASNQADRVGLKKLL